MGGCGSVGIMAALTANSKLPNVQVPQSRRKIPNYSLLKARQSISDTARLLGRRHRCGGGTQTSQLDVGRAQKRLCCAGLGVQQVG